MRTSRSTNGMRSDEPRARLAKALAGPERIDDAHRIAVEQNHRLLGLGHLDEAGEQRDDHHRQRDQRDPVFVEDLSDVHFPSSPEGAAGGAGGFFTICGSGRYELTPGASTMTLSLLLSTPSIVS